MIPTLAMQVAAAAAAADAMRQRKYLGSLSQIHDIKNRARKQDKDRIALQAVLGRPGLTSGQLAQLSTLVTRSMWSRHLCELAQQGLLSVRVLPPHRRRNGNPANCYVIIGPGRALLADLQRMCRTAATEQVPARTEAQTTPHVRQMPPSQS